MTMQRVIFFFQAEDGIRDYKVTGVQTCALPICFVGARSEVAEGVIVREGSVLSMGVFIGASTRIIDRSTGETFQGEVPAYSVVVPGSLPGKAMKDGTPGPSLYCAVIVKRVDEKTRAKTSINELLRD